VYGDYSGFWSVVALTPRILRVGVYVHINNNISSGGHGQIDDHSLYYWSMLIFEWSDVGISVHIHIGVRTLRRLGIIY
jgi:hypothetical protein